MKQLALPLLITLFAAVNVDAETISIVRGLTFEGHEFAYSSRNDQTFVSDVYTINAAPVVLPNDSYDALVVDLGVRSDKRIVVDDVASPVRTTVSAAWQRPNAGIAAAITPYTVNYVNGSGDLPGTRGSALVNLSSDGHGIFAEDDLTQVNGAFSFQRIQIASTFGPFDGGGQYDLSVIRQVTFSYTVAGNIGDPGIFTSIVDVPEPGSLAILGFGGLLLARRRK